jgi:hypothetical protein
MELMACRSLRAVAMGVAEVDSNAYAVAASRGKRWNGSEGASTNGFPDSSCLA